MNDRPRLSIAITSDQQREISNRFPHGFQAKVFSFLVEDLLKLMDERGDEYVLGEILKRELTAGKILKIGEENGDS